MFDFLKKSKPQPQPKPRQVIKVIERELGSLTLAEWQADDRLCLQAQNVLHSPIFRQMLQVLQNSHPAFNVMLEGDLNQRALYQRFCEGYTSCLATLQSMGIKSISPKPIEADFGEEQISDYELAPFKASGNKTA